MKRMILNIMATMGITLVVLSIVALCYDATVICINTVFQSLLLNVRNCSAGIRIYCGCREKT